MGFTLDTGAFIALQRKKQRAWRFVELAAEDGMALRAPADVLAEFWRGTPLIRPLTTLLDSAIQWIDVTPALAKRAGGALARVGSGRAGPSAIDAVVASVAAAFGDTVLTSDPADFERLAQYYRSLRVLSV